MSSLRLILRSLRHYWRTNLGVLFGAAVTSAVLVGALAVGDSVNYTLRLRADQRLGQVREAMLPGDRYVLADLADQLAEATGADIAPVILLPGAAERPDGSARANDIQVLGVDGTFFDLAPRPAAEVARRLADDPGGVYLNESLARQLGIRPGEAVILLLPEPGLLPGDAALAGNDVGRVVLNKTVLGIVNDEQFGRFGLAAKGSTPRNLYVHRGELAGQIRRRGRANMLLADSAISPNEPLEKLWRLDDVELAFRDVPNLPQRELHSGRVFLSKHVAAKASALRPDAAGVLTYLVNELRCGVNRTPYSMVSAVEPGGMFADVAPEDLADDEIVLNNWLASDLAAQQGDAVTLRYYILGSDGTLREAERTFRVRRVVQMQGLAADPTLMPDFPGISGQESCSQWEADIPIDLDRIRPKDEEYWDAHRGTPKAFVTLRAGQQMWANRYGDLTAVRYPAPAGSIDTLAADLRASLNPAELGLVFVDVRNPARRAAGGSVDFGGLFLGLSFFLMASAVLLTAMVFVFGLQQRSGQIGVLAAMGFPRWRIGLLVLGEAALLAAAGSALGAPMGLAYTRAVLAALDGAWAGAVAGTAVVFHATAGSVFGGFGASLLTALCAMAWTIRRQLRTDATVLLSGPEVMASPRVARGRRRIVAGASAAMLGGAVVLGVAFGTRSAQQAAGAFFAAGAMVLLAGLGGGWWLLGGWAARGAKRISKAGLALRGAGRRRGRSVAAVALLAVGVFLVLSMAGFRLDPTAEATQRHSGTGGFALWAESSLPIAPSPDSAAGRKALGLREGEWPDIRLVGMSLREGDEASCLNLNRAPRPEVLGVRPSELQSRGAFRFAGTAEGLDASLGWELLNAPLSDGAIPAVADVPTLRWALGKAVGDTIELPGLAGPVRVRFVGTIESSILQGYVMISRDAFRSAFGAAPRRVFLIDAPFGQDEQIAAELSRAGRDIGLEVVPTRGRLARFAEVQNTYLSIFTVLGGLGLLLGSLGFGIVVGRNVLQRRDELALLRAVGYTRRHVGWLVAMEHLLLVFGGAAVGLAAAAVAIGPALARQEQSASWMALLAWSAGVLVSGSLWTILATAMALRGRLLDALRSE